MDFLDKVIEIIEGQKGEEKLNVNENEYHLFLRDAHVLIYLDIETNTFKVEVEMFDEGRAKVFFSDSELDDLMG